MPALVLTTVVSKVTTISSEPTRSVRPGETSHTQSVFRTTDPAAPDTPRTITCQQYRTNDIITVLVEVPTVLRCTANAATSIDPGVTYALYGKFQYDGDRDKWLNKSGKEYPWGQDYELKEGLQGEWTMRFAAAQDIDGETIDPTKGEFGSKLAEFLSNLTPDDYNCKLSHVYCYRAVVPAPDGEDTKFLATWAFKIQQNSPGSGM
jgi:hypothetical protein